ncbi:MAG: PIN domain-containing protein [Alkalinema sp. RU_4_3]|nr:PIN domain-containing protein [Alkalinema sp. RU_4_3]
MIAIDTGVFVALFNQRDPNHHAVQSALRTIQEPLITTYPVLTETCYFLLSRPGKLTPPEFLRQVSQGLVEIFQLQPGHLVRMIELMERYADRPMDFADASLVVLAEHLGHGRILTVDRSDFSTYRWNNNQAFENLVL